MTKYGKGLGKEIYKAVESGEIKEPFAVSDCKKYAFSRDWKPTEKYLRVVLANSEKNRGHSESYKDYFIRVGEGLYKINPHISL